MERVSAGSIVVWGVAGALTAMNAVITRRVWASPIFERPQKIAQSVLIWLIPGSFVLVRQVLAGHEPRRLIDSSDATAGNEGGLGYGGSIETGGHHSWDAGGGGGGGGSVGGAD